ncbi:MAG TPA: A/G-specific adenine glycosylase [Methylococcaceae bacterium]|nr:A/G-specific adenine glycosylase [Methylococcaceae bacterium]
MRDDTFDFAKHLLAWFDVHGRKDLPWQQDKSPYRVWISEIMLQQTQVSTVIPYYRAFMARFSNVESLASAPIDDVLQHWAGLGYYARARNLHKAAQQIIALGALPNTLSDLVALPGIGQSTAGAILSLAFDDSHPILDGNVKRVLTRVFAIEGWPGRREVESELWALSAELTPRARCADYTQAIMDLGATLCTRSRPRCMACPMQSHCQAYLTQTVAHYPQRKPPKTLPVKPIFFLVMRNAAGECWLEQRPMKGIWGGLWSLPEIDRIQDVEMWCNTHELTLKDQHILAVQRHTFSHYHLDYTPLLLTVAQDTPSIHWHAAAQWQKRALPAPINTLLTQLMTENFL